MRIRLASFALRAPGMTQQSRLLMDLPDILLLVAAGIIGGIISSIAGGAALFIFPALLATGLSPVVATAVSTTALTPSLFLAALYDRAQLPPLDRSLLGMIVVSMVGGLAGAALLLLTPERMFAALVPLLLGFATVLFAYAGRISTWLTARAAPGGGGGARHSLAALLAVCVYGGYFGAGVGVLMLGVLSVAHRRRLSLRQRHQEPGVEPQQPHRRDHLRGAGRGGLAGDPGDDRRHARRRARRRQIWRR